MKVILFCRILLIIYLIVLVDYCTIKAQPIVNVDSIRIHLDSLYVVDYQNIEDTIAYYKQELRVSTKKYDRHLMLHYKQILGNLYNKIGEYKSAISLHRQVLDISSRLGDSIMMATTHESLGFAYLNNGHFQIAMDSYFYAFLIRNDLSNKSELDILWFNISTDEIYLIDRDYERALGYYLYAIEILTDRHELALLRLKIGLCYLQMASFDESKSHFAEAYRLIESSSTPILFAQYLSNMGLYHEKLDQYDSAQSYYLESLREYIKVKSYSHFKELHGLAEVLFRYSNICHLQEDYSQSVLYANKSLSLSTELKYHDLIQKLHRHLAIVNFNVDQYDIAYQHLDTLTIISDSIHMTRLEDQREYLSYTNSDDNLHIVKDFFRVIEEMTKRRNALLIVLILFTLLALVTAAYLFQRQKSLKLINAKNEELNQKRIDQLLNEQEIKSINSMIEGQEIERKRIAEDLHDRLGSMISAIKLNFGAVQEQVKDSPAYQKANELLDDAVTEVREISHNMLSGVLTKFGLVAALNDLKDTVESSGQVTMNIFIHQLDDRLNNQIELQLYRIVQEFVSNVLKHSRASKIVIQLTRHNGTLTLMVEDNGIGFRADDTYKGMGLKNIQSRVAALEGSWNTDSVLGHGTTNIIEIPV